MARLSYQQKKRMKPGTFALPKERKYPIPDIAHGRNALARVDAYGNADEKLKVRRAVFARYPSLKGGRSWDLYQKQKKARAGR